MTSYEHIEVSESQLEDMIRRSPQLIEDELQYIDHQSFTKRGPLDVLLIDSGQSLVIAELKVVESDSMLAQGLDYYDYIFQNLDGYARAYNSFNIDTSQKPRLFLIAPSFSVSLLNRIKWIDIPISLFTYQCIKLPDQSEAIPIFKEINAPSFPEKIESYSIDDHYKYIKDSQMRDLAKNVVEKIKSWNTDRIFAEALKYSISIKFDGSVVTYLEPRRQHFVLGTYDSEGKWTTQQIYSENDIESFTPTIKAYFETLNGS